MGIDRNRFTRKQDDAWVEWLSDDSPPQPAQQAPKRPVVHSPHSERLRNAGLHQSAVAPAPPASMQNTPTVSIQISLPKLPKIRVQWRQLRYYVVLFASCLVLAIGVRASLGLFNKNNDKPAVQGASTEKSPTYKPVYPEDKKDSIASDSAKSAYDPQRKLYAYKDIYLGAQLTISQQPLPEAFKKNPADIVKAADSINAKEKFETAFGTAYKGYDEKTAVERVVFAYRDLLVFIQSNKKFDADTWKLYIESLRQ